jgi:DNA helicase-2/ATP-dependent DNA helicase PcrA
MFPQYAGADPFAALNEAQRGAVEHDDSPLLVIAGAGTGKTMTLAARVACLVLRGADPQRLLMLTFSRRAAREMERRVGTLLHRALRLPASTPAPALPWAGTFHAVGARLLREAAARLGLAPGFTIHDRADAEALMGLARQDLGLAATKNRFPLAGTCVAIYSRAVNSQAGLADVLNDHFPWCTAWLDELKRLFRAYVQAKQQQHVLDYDDLLLYWHEAMAEPALARSIGGRFDHVLVDEYQDTNRLQAAILRALKLDGRGLTVVGDDAQSIYAFRAAEVRNILDFPRTFSPPARVVALERNYRSTQPLLDSSNAVIALAAERFTKRLVAERASGERPQLVAVGDEAEQARWVADEVLARREGGLALKRQAVLFRAAPHSTALELELVRRDIPFVKYGGLRFLEAAHVKDLLSILRWAQNPRSRLAGWRVALLVPGIGPGSARRLLDAMEQAEDPHAALQAFAPPAAAADEWHAFAALYGTLREGSWPADVERALGWYLPHLRRLHDAAAPREADLAQLAHLAAGYASRERFLAELTLDPPAATSDEAAGGRHDEDYLILSTIHSAKGQEWSAVYVLNAVDGCIPSDMATGRADEIEEERRLLYVAMTRAKQHLALVVPQRFYVTQQAKDGDRQVWASLTRFVPAEVARLFDRIAPFALPQAVPVEPEVPALDLPGRMKALWT